MEDEQILNRTARRSISSSFVYPVKSLLTGIQPTTNQPVSSHAQADSGISPTPSNRSISRRSGLSRSYTMSSPTGSPVTERRTRHSVSTCQSADSSSPPIFNGYELSRLPAPRRSSEPSPCYNIFLGEHCSFVPGPLTGNPLTAAKLPSSINQANPPVDDQGMNFDPPKGASLLPGYPPSTAANISDSDHISVLHAPALEGNRGDDVAGEYDFSYTHVEEAVVSLLPSSPSKFVHLGPISSSTSSSANEMASSATSGISSNLSALPTMEHGTFPPLPGSSSCSPPSFVPAEAQTADEAYPRTFRFQYAQDEHGHHVVIGREGHLRRCEDEPIRTPGAVQGFGVLIAVEETDDALLVRQVSENSTELLGLTPSYLFSISCFTDTLPDSQASLLWDNIQFLSEPASNEDEEEDNLHVFSLTGWGEPGSALPGEKYLGKEEGRRTWTCWCAIHRTDTPSKISAKQGLIIMEFELERDLLNPLYPPSPIGHTSGSNYFSTGGSGKPLPNVENEGTKAPTSSGEQDDLNSQCNVAHEVEWTPVMEDIMESTTTRAKPLPVLERLRRLTHKSNLGANSRRARIRPSKGVHVLGSTGMMDIFAVIAQINEQFDAAPDLDTFLKVVVGIVKDLTLFHRVVIYRFDEVWNGQVVAELMDWDKSHDLYQGLNFPASDIPAQARALYAINKVRLLYDRTQTTARIVVKSEEDLRIPLNMTHSYLRAMSPIHLKYLENMGVRASMSISILAFGQLWGLIACHAYGDHGMRVSFPIRQLLGILSQAVSRNVERLSYASMLYTRKMINSFISDRQPTGYIVSNANDLLSLFDADFGILVVGEGAKILGSNQHGQEILVVAEYLRLKRFTDIQASQAITVDFPELQLTTGLETIAGMLCVPLSSEGKDFIALLRKEQKLDVRWAGQPYKDNKSSSILEPRKSFHIWCETVAGRCRAWTDEQLEIAGVLALVYGKFIEVWRQEETATEAKLTSLLLSNATHEVRTPLNHIINYLEMALNGPLDVETRANLSQSHTASKSLLFTINDLLDLTKLEVGNKTSFNEPFSLHETIEEATLVYRNEAARRQIEFYLDMGSIPEMVIGDAKKIQTVVQNLTANALKYTAAGSISLWCNVSQELNGLGNPGEVIIELIVADTGCGIPAAKLEVIFREFEQVGYAGSRICDETGVGLGLAVVARNVQQLGGQLRVESKEHEGTRFSILIPLALPQPADQRRKSIASTKIINDLTLGALGVSAFDPGTSSGRDIGSATGLQPPIPGIEQSNNANGVGISTAMNPLQDESFSVDNSHLRILVVEDNDINRTILTKRLRLNGHAVVNACNGLEGLTQIEADQAFDAIFMDIQMPLLNGFEATQRIRTFEQNKPATGIGATRISHVLNGRIPIFAVSASLKESQHLELVNYGLDGWILKPIDFKRLKEILNGVIDPGKRKKNLYCAGYNWESGGWFTELK